MWLLTCDGDLLEGKRLWLRPGTTHLLGRTSGRSENGERIQYINHKSVSRKHLTLEVLPVPKGHSSKLFVKSELRVTDGSKLGTKLNEETLVKGTKTLDGKEYEITLGSYEHRFHLIWHPVTLSITISPKKAKEEILNHEGRREILEQADIKLVGEYVTNETTHAVAKKRNTTAALQTLIQGRWLLTESYLDALVGAIKFDAPAIEAPIEQDFDAYWPSEEDHLVPPGGEPIPRPSSFLKPNVDRLEIFQNFTFIFLSQGQYDNLLPVLTSGGGKALVREVEIGETGLDDVVDYVKEVAGRKHDARFRLSQQVGNSGVVVVRLHDRGAPEREFMRSIDLALDQRSIEQSEFLDAILTVDASNLRRALEEADDEPNVNDNEMVNHLSSHKKQGEQPRKPTVAIADSPRPAGEEQQPAQEQTTMEDQAPEQPPKRRNRRIITQSRFKGFDDFDPSQFSRAASSSPEPSVHEPEASQANAAHNMDVDQLSQPQGTQRAVRKRPLPEPSEEDMFAEMLPGNAAMKRRKMEAAARGEDVSSFHPAAASKAGQTTAAKGKKKKQKELDVMAEVQKQREAQEVRRRHEEEDLRQAMEGVDIKELRNLAKVEDMEIPARKQSQRDASDVDGGGARWDPAWNGRKNFKKFRRQGEHQNAPQLRRVLVTLEEVPRKGHGLGYEYWVNGPSSTTGRSSNQSQSQSQTQNSRQSRSQHGGTSNSAAAGADERDDDDTEVSRFRRRVQKSREEDAEAARVEASLPREMMGERIQGTPYNNSTPSQTFATDSQRRAAGKRPATQQGGRAAKKVRQAEVNLEEDDDGLKFRRRR